MVIVLVSILGFVLLCTVAALVLQHFLHSSDIDTLIQSHHREMQKMIDKIHQPDARFMEAMRRQAEPVDSTKEVARTDEDWLKEEQSLVQVGDDLSPIFDPDEG